MMNWSFSSNHPGGIASAARNWINSGVPQTAVTTFAISSVFSFTLLLCCFLTQTSHMFLATCWPVTCVLDWFLANINQVKIGKRGEGGGWHLNNQRGWKTKLHSTCKKRSTLVQYLLDYKRKRYCGGTLSTCWSTYLWKIPVLCTVYKCTKGFI